MKKIFLIPFLYLIAIQVYAQDDSIAIPQKITVNGYIKDLQFFTCNKNFKESVTGNLIHNRVNIKWKPTGRITVAAEFRNRLFWGEEVKRTPDFAAQLRNENERVNLQQAWIKNRSLVLHTNVERLYADFRHTAVNVRIGRQRINWGITTNWNPNDIFNTYNFLDFDYEERPGVDGVKFQYLVNGYCNVEAAYAQTGKKKGNIAAMKYNLNKQGYDFQLITGWFKQYVTVGAGWAGNIKDAGFKGELQGYFGGKDSANLLNMSLEGDYMFKKGWYVNVGLLFNNQGLYKPVNNWNAISLKLSPENPMPTKWNIMVTAAKEFTPLWSANFSLLFAPGSNLFILFPSLQYNIAANLDISLVWQSFFMETANRFEAVNHRGFFRVKWSF